MIHTSKETEKRAVMQVAELMAAAARTAPKGCGIDNIEAIIIDGADKDQLSEELRKIAKETGEEWYARDGRNLEASHCVVILGVHMSPIQLSYCGDCGNPDCATTIQLEGRCAFNLVDLGIAVGSAVSVAANHRIDNRVMWSVGKAVKRLGFVPEEVKVAYGIPLSTSGKSPFFDRAISFQDEGEI